MSEHASHAPISPAVYFRTFVALLALMVLTILVWWIPNSQGIHVNPYFAVGAALVIAVIKASLVVLYFMGVKYSSRLTWLWAGLGFLWLAFMLGILVDFMTRGYQMPLPAPF